MTFRISAFFSIARAETCLKNLHVASKKNPTLHISPSSWDMLTEVGNVISDFFSALFFFEPILVRRFFGRCTIYVRDMC